MEQNVKNISLDLNNSNRKIDELQSEVDVHTYMNYISSHLFQIFFFLPISCPRENCVFQH